MSIESKISPEELNIKNFSVENPELTGEVFNPEKDLKNEDWTTLRAMLDKDRRENQPGFLGSHARELKALFPNRLRELNLTNEDWVEIKDFLDSSIEAVSRNNQWDILIERAANLKILFPERFTEIKLEDTIEQGIEDDLERQKQSFLNKGSSKIGSGSPGFAEMIKNIKIVWPEKLIELASEQLLRQKLNDIASEYEAKKDWAGFLHLAAAIKILFPEYSQDLMSTQIWAEIKKYITAHTEATQTKGFWFASADIYENAMILSAETVKFTDKGMELEMGSSHPTLNKNRQELPEIKKF